MFTPEVIYTIIILGAFFLGMICLSIFLYLFDIFHWQKNLIHEEHEILKKTSRASSTIMEDTHAQSLKILDHTEQLRIDVAARLEENLARSAKEIENSLATDTENLSTLYKNKHEQMLKDVESKYDGQLEDIFTQLKTQASTAIASFEKLLEEETLGAKKMMEETIHTKLTVIDNELESYRVKKIQEIDNSTRIFANKVLNEVLSKSLTEADQEILITQALEHAKDEGMFEKSSTGEK